MSDSRFFEDGAVVALKSDPARHFVVSDGAVDDNERSTPFGFNRIVTLDTYGVPHSITVRTVALMLVPEVAARPIDEREAFDRRELERTREELERARRSIEELKAETHRWKAAERKTNEERNALAAGVEVVTGERDAAQQMAQTLSVELSEVKATAARFEQERDAERKANKAFQEALAEANTQLAHQAVNGRRYDAILLSVQKVNPSDMGVMREGLELRALVQLNEAVEKEFLKVLTGRLSLALVVDGLPSIVDGRQVLRWNGPVPVFEATGRVEAPPLTNAMKEKLDTVGAVRALPMCEVPGCKYEVEAMALKRCRGHEGGFVIRVDECAECGGNDEGGAHTLECKTGRGVVTCSTCGRNEHPVSMKECSTCDGVPRL